MLVISFTVLPNVVCRYLGISFGRYIRDTLVPVLPAIAVAGLVAVVLLKVSPVRAGASVLRGGVRGLIEAALVVLAAWAVMFAVVLRIEPDIRGVILAKLRRRGR